MKIVKKLKLTLLVLFLDTCNILLILFHIRFPYDLGRGNGILLATCLKTCDLSYQVRVRCSNLVHKNTLLIYICYGGNRTSTKLRSLFLGHITEFCKLVSLSVLEIWVSGCIFLLL